MKRHYNVMVDETLKNWAWHRAHDLRKSLGEYLEYLIRLDMKEAQQ